MTMGERYVSTADIRSALAGRETELLDALNIPWRGGKPHIPCPYRAHADDHPSWRWDERKRKAFCTCGARDVLGVLMGVEGTDVDAAKIRAAELLKRPDLIRERKPRGKGGHANPPEQKRKRATPAGCALIAYAAAKGLPADFLLSVGIREINYLSAPALRIPYFGAEGGEPAIRFRLALEGKDRFVWRKGAKARLYGLQRIDEARKAGYIVLVEGETDCCTLWHNGFPALGLPGATNWNEERDAPLLADIPTIYVVIEPDEGGEQMLGWLQRSSIAPRVRLVKLPEKDPNALYLLDRDGFPVAFRQALDEAEPYQVIADRTRANDLHAARQAAGELAGEPDILGQFEKDLKAAGLVGEERNAKVLYLVHTTRVFDRPVSVAVKGVSSGGKSYTVESVLKFFPISTFWTRTALSERALAYSDEDFRRRHLVLFEAAGMTGDIANYLMRSLLSEGRIRYEVVEKTRDGLRPRVIEKDGPTGLIVTTTATRLHPENETRLLSLAVKDTPEQTAAVMLALARDQRTDAAVGYARWHAYQQWLAAGECRVVVPFASRLAQLIQPVAVRLRRDFGLLLQLIRAHTLLHREHRPQDCDGRIMALPADYAAVHNLVADQFAEGVATTVKQTTRDTVDAVKRLAKLEVTVTEIAKELKLDTSAASRRVSEARSSGYLVNNETGKGRPARIALGDPMPTELEILPHPDQLADCCRVAPLQEGIDTPLPPSRLRRRTRRDRDMTGVADLLAEIHRSGGNLRLVGCDRLKLVAPRALLPELTDRVRAAKPKLLAALAETASQVSTAQEGGDGVSNPRRKGATAQHPTFESAPDRAISTPAADWRARHREALAYWDALHPTLQAAQLAWGEIENRWHRLHGRRWPQWLCAGCDQPIGGLSALDLADGNRVHLGGPRGLDCLLAFGERWRGEATAGLRALGFDPPAEGGSA